MEIEFLKTQVFTFCFYENMETLYTDKSGEKHVLDDIKVTIECDNDYYEEEFFHSDLVKIDIMPHRHYEFLHEMDLQREYLTTEYEEDDYYYEDWKAEQEKWKKINEEYYVFGIDFFEHSAMSFSLAEKRKDIGYYEFDRTRNVGYIAVKKDELMSYSQAMKIAEETLEEYTNYCNGRIYEYRVTDNEDNGLDCCTGFYKEEHAEQVALDYVRYYLQTKGIEFTDVQLN